MKIPKDVLDILRVLNENGHEAYIVGGCVRDSILGREPMDWDITTSAMPEETKGLFAHTFDTGIQHGTITVVLNKENYEVTTYRIDGEYADCRRPDSVVFTKKLEEDLLRRDFTMNAIAYHPQEGFQDPFGGQADIADGCIRGVGDAATRFQEDALRMLRCARFAAQLGFAVEDKTYQALCENVMLIRHISVERIREEMTKLWQSKHVTQMPILWESGLLTEIDGEFAEHIIGKAADLLSQAERCPKDEVLRWSVVLHGVSEKWAQAFLKKLKFDNASMKEICLLVRESVTDLPTEAYEIRRLASKVGVKAMEQLLVLQEILRPQSAHGCTGSVWRKVCEDGDCLTLKELAIGGQDLMKMGVPAGKQMGEILNRLLDEVHKEPSKNESGVLVEIVKGYLEGK